MQSQVDGQYGGKNRENQVHFLTLYLTFIFPIGKTSLVSIFLPRQHIFLWYSLLVIACTSNTCNLSIVL